ncbi:MAG: DegV family protein [Asgard group archaeon]|nr:DegV family protein [Asgard group archaeon]
MKKVAIVTDGVCDLTKDMVEKYKIVTVPYRIIFDEDVYRIWHNENSSISLAEFNDRIGSVTKDNLPRTSLPSPGEFKQGFDEALENADSVIAVILTSGMSGAVQTAQSVVSNEFPDKDVAVFDSQQTMTGTGIQALVAARMAADGKSKKEILEKLEKLKPKVRTLFAMNDLDYLEKQGRLGPIQNTKDATAIPLIHMKDGILQPLGIYKDEADLIEQMSAFGKQIMKNSEINDVFLTHINHPDASKQIYDAMKENNPNGINIHYYEAGAILGVYSGPKTISIGYIGDFDRSWVMKG